MSHRTVDYRRATLKKMQARSPVELAELLTLVRPIEEWHDRRHAETRGAANGLAQQSSSLRRRPIVRLAACHELPFENFPVVVRDQPTESKLS